MTELPLLLERAGLKPNAQDNVGAWVTCIPSERCRPDGGVRDSLLTGVSGRITAARWAPGDNLELDVEIPGGRMLNAHYLSSSATWEFSWQPVRGVLRVNEGTPAATD